MSISKSENSFSCIHTEEIAFGNVLPCVLQCGFGKSWKFTHPEATVSSDLLTLWESTTSKYIDEVLFNISSIFAIERLRDY